MAAGVITRPAVPGVSVPSPVIEPPAGHSNPDPAAVLAALIASGAVAAPVASVGLSQPPPTAAAIVAWATAQWWPGLAQLVGVNLGAAGLADDGLGGVAILASIVWPDGALADVVSTINSYVTDAATALLAGKQPPAWSAETVGRLRLLRALAARAAIVGYAALRGVAPPP